MGKGKDQNRQDEQNTFKDSPDTAFVFNVEEAFKIPLGDQVNGGCRQGDDERVDQHLRQPQHGAAADGKKARHDAYAGNGQYPPIDTRPAELVDDEAIDHVGDADAVNEHRRHDGQTVQYGDEEAAIAA